MIWILIKTKKDVLDVFMMPKSLWKKLAHQEPLNLAGNLPCHETLLGAHLIGAGIGTWLKESQFNRLESSYVLVRKDELSQSYSLSFKN